MRRNLTDIVANEIIDRKVGLLREIGLDDGEVEAAMAETRRDYGQYC